MTPSGPSSRRLARGPTAPIRRLAPALGLASSLVLGPAAPAGAEPERPSLVAHRLAEGARIAIDGHLDEPAWAAAARGEGFVERVPNTGRPAPVPSVLRVLYDADALYVGLRMGLLPGETPRGLERGRDSFRIFSDDAVTVKIDVFLDRRTTFGFGVNVANAQIDYVAVDNGAGGFRREHDVVWESATAVEADAWVAELRIPAAALGLARVDGPRRIGLNVSRDHNARIATDDWSHMPPEYGPVTALHYGTIEGLDGLGGGTPLSLIPFVRLARPADAGAGRPGELGLGGDLRVRVGRGLWGELTAFTDFAQVDLDDPVVNLDRFPLFFPERRGFFLAGVEVFEFGELGSSQLYFSRRIGLDAEGGAVPVLAGAKLYGRIGPVALGLLDVLTDGTDGQPARNQTVVRTRWNATDRAYVGAMATLRSGTPGQEADLRWGAGLDGRLRLFGERLDLYAFAALAPDEDEDALTDALSGQLLVRWIGEHAQPQASLRWTGPEHAPALGFVRRPDSAVAEARLPFVWRPRAWGIANGRASLIARHTRSSALDTDLGYDLSLELGLSRQDGWSLDLGADWIEDVVQSDFALFGALPVAAGRYAGPRLRIELGRSDARNPSGAVRYSFASGFFGGRLHQASGELALAIGAPLRLSLAPSVAHVELPGLAPRTETALAAGLELTPTTTLLATLVLQLNTSRDSATVLARIRWRYLPGSDAFLVYREDVDLAGARRASRSLTLKLAYRHDLLL